MAAEHEKPNDYLRRKGIPLLTATGVTHDREAFLLAAQRLWTPNDLTGDDVRQLALIDADLGALANAKMYGFDGDSRERLAKFGTKTLTASEFNAVLDLSVMPILLLHKWKQARTSAIVDEQAREIATLKREMRELQQYVRALDELRAEPVA